MRHKKIDPQVPQGEMEQSNWMLQQVKQREAQKQLPEELVGRMSTKTVIHETPPDLKFPTPYHKFKYKVEEAQIWVKTQGDSVKGSGGLEYIWGFDSRSVKGSLGAGFGHYTRSFREGNQYWLEFIAGPCAYAFRNMWGLGVLCWLSLFVAGLLQIRFSLPLVWITVGAWHLGCGWFFNEVFLTRFVGVYRKMAQPFREITKEQHQRIVRLVGENPRLAGVYAVVEIGVIAGMLALVKVFGYVV